jgi:RNA-splicing ligase RtcB
MPDLVVDCGKPVGASLTFDQATLLVEVLYPTKGGFDVTVKLRPNANC